MLVVFPPKISFIPAAAHRRPRAAGINPIYSIVPAKTARHSRRLRYIRSDEIARHRRRRRYIRSAEIARHRRRRHYIRHPKNAGHAGIRAAAMEVAGGDGDDDRILVLASLIYRDFNRNWRQNKRAHGVLLYPITNIRCCYGVFSRFRLAYS